MADKESRPISELIATGASPSTLRSMSKGSGNDLVTVQDWQVCYGSNGLIESCTVTAKDGKSPITSVGLLAYSADDQTLYCSQFTGGIGSASVSPSVTAGGFNLQVGEKMLGVVFGYIEGVEFFFEETLTIVACGP